MSDFGNTQRSDSTIEELADVLKDTLGIDVATCEVVASYTGESRVKRWILFTEDKEWVLVQDFLKSSFAELLSGGGPNTIMFASAPLFLLTVDPDFQLSSHANVYECVREAMKEHGVKDDGAPYLTVASISPTQAVMIENMLKKLSWDASEVVIESIGHSGVGSGITLYNDPDGQWKVKR